jgi:hypothetical protein
MAEVIVYQGAVAPESLLVNVGTGSSGIDMTTITSAYFKVKRPDLVEEQWTAVIQSASAPTIALRHTFVVADTAKIGTHEVVAYMFTPGGVIRSAPQTFFVDRL